MIVNKIKLKKSRTIGYLDEQGKTKFRKIELLAEGELSTGESEDEAYDELSAFIERSINKEKK